VCCQAAARSPAPAKALACQRLLGLVEQARVLDRDHGLVGEGLQQLDLLGGKRLRRLTQDADRSDAGVLPQHGREDGGVVARQLRNGPRDWRCIGSAQRIRYVHRLTPPDRQT
jgi:hypothetical protein